MSTSGQFHQHFIKAFAPFSLRQKSLTYTSRTKMLSYKKAARKMLVTLTPAWQVSLKNVFSKPDRNSGDSSFHLPKSRRKAKIISK
jgi:hypothetical protein